MDDLEQSKYQVRLFKNSSLMQDVDVNTRTANGESASTAVTSMNGTNSQNG